jgi:hypothetical protein
MRYNIICEECDSEYQIEYEQGMLSDDIQYCTVCKSKIEPELISDEE